MGIFNNFSENANKPSHGHSISLNDLRKELKGKEKEKRQIGTSLKEAGKSGNSQLFSELGEKKKQSDLTIKAIKNQIKYYNVTYREDLVNNDIILSVQNLKQFFSGGGGFKTKAVHDISFDIKEKECFGLVGESGCGKTTTGRSIIRLYNITSGSIFYKGFRISGGTRWNEKEIKWSQIHAKERIKLLRKEEKAKISATADQFGSEANLFRIQNEYREKRRSLKAEETEELREKSDPSNDDSEQTASEIEASYQKRFSVIASDEKRALDLLKARKEGKDELISSIKSNYAAQIKKIRDEENKHVKEQKAIISQIQYDNKHVDKKLMAEIQMIFQDPVDSLDPRMTVEDIIQEGLRIQHHYNKAENHEKCVEILEKVGLIAEYASRYPHEFSGGQRQRIGIARALIMNPKLLICDEPISALDVSIRAQILNLLNDIKDEMGLTILFIAHDLSVVKYFCNRIAVMYFGNMVELASSDELFAHPLHPYTKALLSAIPKPDPLSEKQRVRMVYNPAESHDYSKQKPTFREIIPGHWILCNDPEETKYLEEIKSIDQSLGK
jgi:ABC-type oligopeptide transport system ATPase subunit